VNEKNEPAVTVRRLCLAEICCSRCRRLSSACFCCCCLWPFSYMWYYASLHNAAHSAFFSY